MTATAEQYSYFCDTQSSRMESRLFICNALMELCTTAVPIVFLAVTRAYRRQLRLHRESTAGLLNAFSEDLDTDCSQFAR